MIKSLTPLEKYRQIMKEYHNVVDQEWVSLHEILETAGESNLIEQMNKRELATLLKETTGVMRLVFKNALEKRKKEEYNDEITAAISKKVVAAYTSSSAATYRAVDMKSK